MAELEAAVSDATAVAPAYAREEIDRVLALGALARQDGPEGMRFVWTE